jgi:hypothetical protein
MLFRTSSFLADTGSIEILGGGLPARARGGNARRSGYDRAAPTIIIPAYIIKTLQVRWSNTDVGVIASCHWSA